MFTRFYFRKNGTLLKSNLSFRYRIYPRASIHVVYSDQKVNTFEIPPVAKNSRFNWSMELAMNAISNVDLSDPLCDSINILYSDWIERLQYLSKMSQLYTPPSLQTIHFKRITISWYLDNLTLIHQRCNIGFLKYNFENVWCLFENKYLKTLFAINKLKN